MGNAPGNIMVPVVMFGWIPFVMILFSRLEAKIAAAAAFVAGWMFLPVVAYNLPALPDYTKTTATCVGILAGAWLFDKERFGEFRFSAVDIPILLWCTAPFFSSVANGLGPYDGLSQTMYQSITWGLPYYIARIYFSDTEGLKILALAIVIGGIVYIPFCWFEMIMSPQLHRMTYGFHQHSFLQTIRAGGGFRPMVYMDHGLMTSMWMVIAVFLGTWLYLSGSLPKKILFVPTVYLLLLLVFTTMMMKSFGAISLLFLGLIVIILTNKMKLRFLILILLVTPHLYIVTRTTGTWDGRNLSQFVAEKISEERAQSLQFRFDNETILIDKALQGTFFGWGGFGRSRVYDDKGRDISIADGLWIITLGQNGIYGLIALVIAVQLPVVLFLLRVKPNRWNEQQWAAPAVMAVFLAIYMIDNLLNSMINPIYMLFSGGIIGVMLRLHAGAHASIPEAESSITIRQSVPSHSTTRFITEPEISPSRFIS
ncbi:hypothetical protein OO006_13480 [Prosthecochloris sp. SCSIO W1101]|uniref:hypothetical protein n=1 Tax=Prosthecochloris sp. SCSIO W1101 TaxID=2992242 RepID=UPI00223E3320|nr:hypothetical protein [Prosthecochloris sp. SCSIO W1101]UZJ41334.1 hypothetical protein OO006_13480 [Prosthecochloris sp. SCSIO W1101]